MPRSHRRLLILSVSAGAGHVRAAQALEAAANSASPPLATTHLDLLTLVPRDFRKLYGEHYIRLIEKLPQLWSYLYERSDRPSRDSLLGRLKRGIEELNTRKLDTEIARLQPDVPMLLVSPLPGQEERNSDYLLESGAAMKAVDAATLVFKFSRLLGEPARLAAMSGAARRIGRPHAARDVIALVSASA